jgi:hypothetical protein
MSHSRAQRRRQSRGGNAPPPKRDPMTPIYIGLGVVIALVFIAFGITNWLQNRAATQAIAFDYATPSPAPTKTPKPIQLRDLEPIGVATGFPKGDLLHGKTEDTQIGGQGQPVDGIPCQPEMAQVHVHTHLAIFYDGKQVQVPGFVGMVPQPTNPQGGCLYWLHTHGPDGIIHIEAASADNPNGGHYTLGNFFDIWGYGLNDSQVGPFNGPVTAFVDGAPYTGDPRQIPLQSRKQIVLEVGKPVVPPPNYKFPPND